MSEPRSPLLHGHGMQAHQPAHGSARLVGAIGAIGVHLLVVIVLVRMAPMMSMRPPPTMSVITLSLSQETRPGELLAPSISVSAVDQALHSKPPVIELKTLNPSDLAVTTKAPEASAQARAASSPSPRERVAIEPDEASQSLLARLRANWLPPPKSSTRVRCRLRISYRPGGTVTAVTTAPSCNDQLLAASIERAVWKSQPLPMLPKGQAYVDLEFTP